MPRLTCCSMCRLAYLLFLVAPTVVAPGCGSGKSDPATVPAQPSGLKSNDSANDRIADADSPAREDRKTEGNTDNTDDPIEGSEPAVVRLGDIPKLKLAHPSKASAQEANEIEQLIRNLSAIDSPDFGLSGTMSGDAFLPIDGMSEAGALLFTDHQLNSSPELRRLVELGPNSLPFLLDALDDKTPTKLVMKPESSFGVMAFANELWGNPVNRSELKVLGPRPQSLSLALRRRWRRHQAIGGSSFPPVASVQAPRTKARQVEHELA
jgi:hypothetical protein